MSLAPFRVPFVVTSGGIGTRRGARWAGRVGHPLRLHSMQCASVQFFRQPTTRLACLGREAPLSAFAVFPCLAADLVSGEPLPNP